MKILVPISGGKDSQLSLKLAIETAGAHNVLGLFCDTQFEHPATYSHIDKISTFYGVHIHRITAGSVPEKVRKYRRFPGSGVRFCTDELKIRPTIKFSKSLATNLRSGFEIWYGMRTQESTERAIRYRDRVADELYAPHEFMPSKYPKYLSSMGITVRLPILDWSTSQVLAELGDTVNPLYSAGFDRVGCFPCLAAGDVHKEKAFSFDKVGHKHKTISLQLEQETGKSLWTSKGGSMRNNPAQLCMFCTI